MVISRLPLKIKNVWLDPFTLIKNNGVESLSQEKIIDKMATVCF